GLPASMCGLGGGFILVPTLILVFNLPPQSAVAISIVAMFGTTISATLGYLKQKRVDFKLAVLYDVFDIPGVIIGAYLTTILPKDFLIGLCGFFILFLSLLMLRNLRKKTCATGFSSVKEEDGWGRKVQDSMNHVFEYKIRKPGLVVLSSLMSGLVTGLAGLGGGITDTTTMILLGVPSHIAVASSEFAMALTNGAGILTHGFLQNIPFDYAIPITIGTIIGAQFGVLLAKRAKQQTLKMILALISLAFSIRLIIDVLMG
ncbi:MAG: sulfite exporter TauE/SafE family protein, partial [Candidatus Bathyarchaeota archaeon]|nr:sulfite exporter TauE/SafE family protein [Candidatus Bathyarchaeota archaeon]